MTSALLDLIVDERYWLPFSLGLAAAAVVLFHRAQRAVRLPADRRVLSAMNLAVGVVLGTMASGHLLAVIVKLGLGTLRDGSLAMFLAIGLSLLSPSVLIVRHAGDLASTTLARSRRTIVLHGWLAATLLALGLHNMPLASLSLLTIGYWRYSGTPLGWIIVGLAAVLVVGLFSASLVFVASGQSFEQFRGVR